MMRRAGVAILSAVLLLSGCAGDPSSAPTVTVTATVTLSPQPEPTVTVTVSPEAAATPPAAEGGADLTTDSGLCAADSEMTNLELNDAIAPMLGYDSDRAARTSDQDDAIREYKNAAFLRACPARAS